MSIDTKSTLSHIPYSGKYWWRIQFGGLAVFRKSAKFVPIHSYNSRTMALLKYLRNEGHMHECSALSKNETE